MTVHLVLTVGRTSLLPIAAAAVVVVVVVRHLHHGLIATVQRLRLEADLEREQGSVLLTAAAAAAFAGGEEVAAARGEGRADLAELDQVHARRLRRLLLLHPLHAAVKAGHAVRVPAARGRGGEGAGGQGRGQSRRPVGRVQLVRLRRQGAGRVRARALAIAGAVGSGVVGRAAVRVVAVGEVVGRAVVVGVMAWLQRQGVFSHLGIDLLTEGERKH